MRESAGRVLYLQYTNPGAYPPLHHSARLLAEAGFDVLLLGTVRRGDRLKMPEHAAIRVRTMWFEPAGWRQKVHYVRFAAWVVATALRYRPTWLYVSDPLACPVAQIVSKLLRVRLVYHEHDSPAPEGTEGADGSRFWRMVMRARRAVGRSSAVCILPNAQRAETFRQDTGRTTSVHTVWNCPMPDEVAPARETPPPGQLRLVYHGSIVPSRLPEVVLEGMAGLPNGVTLDVIGYETVGHRGYVDALKRAAARFGISHRVRFLGPMSRQELMRGCAWYDVGLSLLPIDATDPNQRTMTGASNKPFDYMASGLALLVSDMPDWRRMFVEAGFGRGCAPESAHSIEMELGWLLDHPRERVALGERGRRQVLAAWNYERVFAPVLSLMRADAADAQSRETLRSLRAGGH
jgi:glycosyltransferase involved in cell wall biosynthesis